MKVRHTMKQVLLMVAVASAAFFAGTKMKGSDATSSIKDFGNDVKNKAKDTGHDVKNAAKDMGQDAKNTAREMSSEAQAAPAC